MTRIQVPIKMTKTFSRLNQISNGNKLASIKSKTQTKNKKLKLLITKPLAKLQTHPNTITKLGNQKLCRVVAVLITCWTASKPKSKRARKDQVCTRASHTSRWTPRNSQGLGAYTPQAMETTNHATPSARKTARGQRKACQRMIWPSTKTKLQNRETSLHRVGRSTRGWLQTQ